MSWGIRTWTGTHATGAQQLMVNSPQAHTHYLVNTIQVAELSKSLDVSGHSNHYSIPSITDGFAMRFDWDHMKTNNATPGITCTSYGYVDTNNTYHPAGVQRNTTGTNSDVSTNLITTSSQDTVAHTFAARSIAPDSHGFYSFNDNGEVIIDASMMPLYYQPQANGSLVRTATAAAHGFSSDRWTWTDSDFFANNPSANITFPQAYVTPPLICIVDSNGLALSVYKMHRNAQGLFIGATVSSSVNLGVFKDGYDNEFTGYTSPTGGTFTYFLVSSQVPTYLTGRGNYGLQVYNGSGGVVFDSRYFMAVPRFITPLMPYVSVHKPSQYSTDFTHWSTTWNNFTAHGACINNYYAFSGVWYYTGWSWTSGHTSHYGPINMYGHYLTKNNADGTLKIGAAGTNTMMTVVSGYQEDFATAVDFYRGSGTGQQRLLYFTPPSLTM